MSEETKNTAELTDKQLEKVAGGGFGLSELVCGRSYSLKIITNPTGIIVYEFADKASRQVGTYSKEAKVLAGVYEGNGWFYLDRKSNPIAGYVLASDFQWF